MHTTCPRLLFSPRLLSSVLLAVISAAFPHTAKPLNPTSTSPPGILQQENPTPWTPVAILTPSDASPAPPNTTVSASGIVPIPGTDIFLRITHFGPRQFTKSLIEDFFAGAHESINEALATTPNEPVAPLPWFFSEYNKQWRDTMALRIRGDRGQTFTWSQLERVLGSLLGFLEGEPGRLHPINFDVNVVGEGIVAAGVLWYSQRPAIEARERWLGRDVGVGHGSA